MNDVYRLLVEQKFISIQKAQSGLSRALEAAETDHAVLRVMRNNHPVGVLIPEKLWADLVGCLADRSLSAPGPTNTKE